MQGYLIYHRRREVKQFGQDRVYCDNTSGNQDPYIWNTRFLHTYCHMTELFELSPEPSIGDYIFWINGNPYPDFSELYCDLVFVIDSKCDWPSPNKIDQLDPIIDSPEAFTDHYLWGCGYEHCFEKRKERFTLKADPSRSFQPQNADGELLNIVGVLEPHEYPLDALRKELIKSKALVKSKKGVPRWFVRFRPLCLNSDTITQELYNCIKQAPIKLTGDKLEKIRKDHPLLASKPPSKPPKC